MPAARAPHAVQLLMIKTLGGAPNAKALIALSSVTKSFVDDLVAAGGWLRWGAGGRVGRGSSPGREQQPVDISRSGGCGCGNEAAVLADPLRSHAMKMALPESEPESES